MSELGCVRDGYPDVLGNCMRHPDGCPDPARELGDLLDQLACKCHAARVEAQGLDGPHADLVGLIQGAAYLLDAAVDCVEAVTGGEE